MRSSVLKMVASPSLSTLSGGGADPRADSQWLRCNPFLASLADNAPEASL